MELAIEQRLILAHVVVDVDAWVNNAVEKVGEWAVLAKIENARQDYLAKKDLPNYMNRAEREAFKTPEDIAREEATAAKALLQAVKAQAFVDNLPSWAEIEALINTFAIPANIKEFLIKQARVVYWLAKNSAD